MKRPRGFHFHEIQETMDCSYARWMRYQHTGEIFLKDLIIISNYVNLGGFLCGCMPISAVTHKARGIGSP